MKRSGTIDKILPVVVFVLLECLSIAMVAGDGIVQKYKLIGFFRSINLTMWRMSDSARKFIDYGVENRRLADENLKLRQALESYRVVDTVSNKSYDKGMFEYISAKVIKSTTNRERNWLILDAGSDCGVTDGMGVITADGVVGIVVDVSERYCKAVSFLNNSQAVSAKICRSGAIGLLSWSGSNIKTARLNEVPTHAEVAEGDTVATSGASSIFPPDIPLGKVMRINSDGIYLSIDTELFQDFSALQYVYIVKNNDGDEIKNLEQ